MKCQYLLFPALLLIVGCSSGLSRSEAFELLEKEYPKELFYQVYTGDLNHAQRMEKDGFVANGLVTVNTKVSFPDRFIHFTNKANDLLLPTPENEKAREIQRVKTGEYHLLKITGIKNTDKKAAVEYTIEVRNLTPFAKLHKKPLIDRQQKTRTAYFIKYDDGWRMDKTEGMEYLLE